jgi:hypothetical protein
MTGNELRDIADDAENLYTELRKTFSEEATITLTAAAMPAIVTAATGQGG